MLHWKAFAVVVGLIVGPTLAFVVRSAGAAPFGLVMTDVDTVRLGPVLWSAVASGACVTPAARIVLLKPMVMTKTQ